MNMRGTGLLWITVMSLALALGGTVQAQTTGWSQTAAGLYNYNDTGNWVGGVINGIWDPSLILLGNQTNTFGAGGTTLSSGLSFGYTGNFDLVLCSDGLADRKLSLGGDVMVNNPNTKTITFGSTTANQKLDVDLGGGTRVFTITGGRNIAFLNTITNGTISVASSSATADGGRFKLSGSTGAAGSLDIEASLHGNVEFNSATAALTAGDRAKRVILKNTGNLIVTGQNGVNTADSVSGNLVIDGTGPRAALVNLEMSIVTTDSGGKNTLLTVNELQRVNRGTVLFRGDNLGVNPIASAAANSSNIKINGVAPTLVGGNGAPGSTTISIIPWAVGGASVSGSSASFVTYTSDNGVRPLSTSTEFATVLGVNATDNVRLTNTTDTVISSATTVNSLILAGQGGSISGPGPLTITSGSVLLTRSTGSSSPINANLNFGAAEGIFHFIRGDVVGGVIDGSGGLTVNGNRANESLQFTNPACLYTGDTTVLSTMSVVGGVLPSGSRTGDVYVHANLLLSVGGFNGTINGLFGNGVVTYGNSGASSIAIGDNNASSTFTGTLAGNVNLNVSKIGTGTLTMTGSNTNAKVMSILGGTLAVSVLANGGVPSGIGSSASTAGNLIISGGTLKYIGPATSSDRLFQVGVSTDGGVATLDASGTGAVNFSNPGALTYGTAGANNTAQTRVLVLSGTNTGANTLSAVIGNNGTATNGNNAVNLTKSGSGTWILTGANTYKGSTTISNGTLAINGSLVSPVTVLSNAVLSGSGWIATNATAVTVNAGGSIDPGSVGGTGTLTVTGNVTFAEGGMLKLDANGVANDLLSVTGTVTAASGTVAVNVNAVGDGPWIVVRAASIVPAFVADDPDMILMKMNGGTELWLYRGSRGTTLIIR